MSRYFSGTESGKIREVYVSTSKLLQMAFVHIDLFFLAS